MKQRCSAVKVQNTITACTKVKGFKKYSFFLKKILLSSAKEIIKKLTREVTQNVRTLQRNLLQLIIKLL
jgi:hypothetical protein